MGGTPSPLAGDAPQIGHARRGEPQCSDQRVRGGGKHWEEGLRLLQDMLYSSLTPDVVSHSAVISSCEKGKHWEEALRLLQEML